MHTFHTPGHPSLTIRTGAGEVSVTATDTDRTTVELTALDATAEDAVRETRVEQDGDTVVVDVPLERWSLGRRSPAIRVAVTCPLDARLEVRAESADIRATGRYAEATLASGSGTITLEDVTGEARVRGGSGDVSVGRVEGPLSVVAGSGDVEVRSSSRDATVSVGSGDLFVEELAGELTSKTGSGDVEVGRLAGALVTKTGSGSLTVRRAAGGAVRATGASGSVSIGIEEGTAAWLDLSTVTGRVSQELGESEPPTEGQPRVEITARTVSGNLRVHRS